LAAIACMLRPHGEIDGDAHGDQFLAGPMAGRFVAGAHATYERSPGAGRPAAVVVAPTTGFPDASRRRESAIG
jgi:hypothetical protein